MHMPNNWFIFALAIEKSSLKYPDRVEIVQPQPTLAVNIQKRLM